MSSDEQQGVVFPRAADGRRSTGKVGRAVVADALRPVDPVGAREAERETNWRTGYLVHFRRLVEAGLASPEAAVSVATAGVESLRARMRVGEPSGMETSLDSWASGSGRPLGTAQVQGTSEAEGQLTLPYHGHRLAGDDLRRALDAWAEVGVLEPSAVDAVRLVLDHPEWLRLQGWTVGVLGAGAEMGPLQALLRWGATVAAVDLPQPPLWQRVLDVARHGAGTMLLPVPEGTTAPDSHTAGVDLLADAPAVADWLAAQTAQADRLVVGNYVYADGATNVRVSVAVDALTTRVAEARADTALAVLATPTDVFAVPGEAVRHSTQGYTSRSTGAKLLGRPLRAVSGGRLL
ncbi:MAG: hypothetical protein ACTHOK_00370, partial [Nocardioidaceae bacterium]